MSAAGTSYPLPSVASSGHVSAGAGATAPPFNYLERFYSVEVQLHVAAEEGLARKYVARLRNHFQVEILPIEAHDALPAAERSFESSGSDERTGTFRTLAALGFKHAEVEKYVQLVEALGGSVPAEKPPAEERERRRLYYSASDFHFRVRSALQRFGLLPLARANAAPL